MILRTYLEFRSGYNDSFVLSINKNAKLCMHCGKLLSGKLLKITNEFDEKKAEFFICEDCMKKLLRMALDLAWHGRENYDILESFKGYLDKFCSRLDVIDQSLIGVKQKQQAWKNIIVDYLKK